MKPFRATEYLRQVNMMQKIIGVLQPEQHHYAVPVKVLVQLRKSFSKLPMACAELGLTQSRISAQTILNIASGDCRFRELFNLFNELQGRLADELSAPRFFSLTDEEADHYNNPTRDWDSILERFSEARLDVEESNKSFAFARYASAVFHSLQVVEFGVIRLGQFIGDADPKPGWTSVTNKLNQILKIDYRNLTPATQAHRPFLEQVQATTEALKTAWRHKVSHAGQRLGIVPGGDFRPEVAKEIMMGGRAFMRRLAEEMPQKPLQALDSPTPN